jgi:hypothetical protein
MIKISIKNVDSTLKSLDKQRTAMIDAHTDSETKSMLEELIESTPIDTGEARSGWKKYRVSPTSVVIANTVSYIQELNRGHSQQAPAHFVESVALRHGTPLGVIVTEIDN